LNILYVQLYFQRYTLNRILVQPGTVRNGAVKIIFTFITFDN
jgi:hypothetical protein